MDFLAGLIKRILVTLRSFFGLNCLIYGNSFFCVKQWLDPKAETSLSNKVFTFDFKIHSFLVKCIDSFWVLHFIKNRQWVQTKTHR